MEERTSWPTGKEADTSNLLVEGAKAEDIGSTPGVPEHHRRRWRQVVQLPGLQECSSLARNRGLTHRSRGPSGFRRPPALPYGRLQRTTETVGLEDMG